LPLGAELKLNNAPRPSRSLSSPFFQSLSGVDDDFVKFGDAAESFRSLGSDERSEGVVVCCFRFEIKESCG